MSKLQPFHVFLAETTRLNSLYWTSKYTYRRMADMLEAIARTSSENANPRVDELWPSTLSGERRHISRPVLEFRQQLIQNEADLRAVAVLQMCSAFEAALANYFALCALYLPERVEADVPYTAVPKVLQRPDEFDNLRAWAIERAGNSLVGPYSQRITSIARKFKFRKPALSLQVYLDIDQHQLKRHLIAHDQGLSKADAPDRSVSEVLASRVTLSEEAWKAVIDDFTTVVTALDANIQEKVVKDRGVALAVYHIVQRDGKATVSELRHRILSERNLDTLDAQAIVDAATDIGLNVVRSARRVVKITLP